MRNIFIDLFKFFPTQAAYAHCDIPCGIYDPHLAQVASHTIIRMMMQINELKSENQKENMHAISRMTLVKENHADIVEEELETLRNDYFKDEHYKKFTNLNDLFIRTQKAVSKARQSLDIQSANEALSGVLEISEIFYKSKNVTPVRIKSVYPTEGEIVIYK